MQPEKKKNTEKKKKKKTTMFARIAQDLIHSSFMYTFSHWHKSRCQTLYQMLRIRCWARLKVLLSCPEQHLIQEDPDLIEKRVRWSLFESISFSRGLMVYDSLLPVLFFLLSSSDSRGGWSLHIRFERHLIWAQKTNYSLFSVHEQTILVRRLMFIGLAAAVSF